MTEAVKDKRNYRRTVIEVFPCGKNVSEEKRCVNIKKPDALHRALSQSTHPCGKRTVPKVACIQTFP